MSLELPTDAREATKLLAAIFAEQEKPASEFRIGAESEKFAVTKEGKALRYARADDAQASAQPPSVCKIFEHLHSNYDWENYREVEGGPVLALTRSGASITLEPSVQLELSGAPHSNLHQVWEEQKTHLAELEPISKDLQLSWLTLGFHPLATLEELSWVPKQRYPLMRQYLPTKGEETLNMMQRTATVQANFDWSDRVDAMKKVRLGLKLSALLQAVFANAPFVEGRLWLGDRAQGAPSPLEPSGGVEAPSHSRRGEVWRFMDPARSGLIERLWNANVQAESFYEEYIDWSLDAGMFLIWREGQVVKNTGQTFREFLRDGYEGHRATVDDYRLHLTTLFPEIRLKNTIEVRPNDGLLPVDAMATVALWTGLLYSSEALDKALKIVEPWTFSEVEKVRADWLRHGPIAEVAGQSGWKWAQQLLALSEEGLLSRGLGEEKYLAPARRCIEARKTPASHLIEQALQLKAKGQLLSAEKIIEMSRMDLGEQARAFD